MEATEIKKEQYFLGVWKVKERSIILFDQIKNTYEFDLYTGELFDEGKPIGRGKIFSIAKPGKHEGYIVVEFNE